MASPTINTTALFRTAGTPNLTTGSFAITAGKTYVFAVATESNTDPGAVMSTMVYGGTGLTPVLITGAARYIWDASFRWHRLELWGAIASGSDSAHTMVITPAAGDCDALGCIGVEWTGGHATTPFNLSNVGLQPADPTGDTANPQTVTMGTFTNADSATFGAFIDRNAGVPQTLTPGTGFTNATIARLDIGAQTSLYVVWKEGNGNPSVAGETIGLSGMIGIELNAAAGGGPTDPFPAGYRNKKTRPNPNLRRKYERHGDLFVPENMGRLWLPDYLRKVA